MLIYLLCLCTTRKSRIGFLYFFSGVTLICCRRISLLYGFASNAPYICSAFFGNNSFNIAVFQAIPLIFYVLATFAYRKIVTNCGTQLPKRIGVCLYVFFGIYMLSMALTHVQLTEYSLLTLMCLQCAGSAFLVPISVLKALQLSAHASTIGASAVVILRNILMSSCITVTAGLHGDVNMIMASILMTVGTAVLLIGMRKVMKFQAAKKARNNQDSH